MKQPWEADISITPEIALALIQDQFPALDARNVDVLGEGWDNLAVLVNGDTVFRMPRRMEGARLLEVEVRWLPQIAPQLPATVPVPRWIGKPQGEYPYPFAGYPHIAGITACGELDPTQLAALGRQVGCFLRALHSIPITPEAASEAPRDVLGKTNLLKWLPRLKERLEAIFSLLDRHQIDRIAIGLEAEALSKTPPGDAAACWVHGDLYARHLLVNEGKLCAVIDWGDMHLGDSALDISIAFSLLPPGEARHAFEEAYGPMDASTIARARFRALHYGAILALYGTEIADAALVTTGLNALRNGMRL